MLKSNFIKNRFMFSIQRDLLPIAKEFIFFFHILKNVNKLIWSKITVHSNMSQSHNRSTLFTLFFFSIINSSKRVFSSKGVLIQVFNITKLFNYLIKTTLVHHCIIHKEVQSTLHLHRKRRREGEEKPFPVWCSVNVSIKFLTSMFCASDDLWDFSFFEKIFIQFSFVTWSYIRKYEKDPGLWLFSK